MCYNATTSLITFSISFFCVIYLVSYGIKNKNNSDIFAGIVSILIGNMQLVEYFLWKNQTCDKINHFFSLFIIVTLVSQGIVGSFFYILLFGSHYTKSFLSMIVFTGILYLLFTVYQIDWLNKRVLCSKPSETSCRLVWAPYQLLAHNKDNGKWLLFIHLLFYFFFFLFCSGLYYGNVQSSFYKYKYPVRCSILPVSFIIAHFYSLMNTNNTIDSWDIFGSTWCFMAVAFGIVSVLHI